MTRPISQMDVEQKMLACIDAMEQATEEYAASERALADAEAKYKKKKAELFLSSSGAVREREAYADYEGRYAHREYLRAVAETKALREVLWSLRNRLDALRSINSNVRAQT